MILGVVTYYYLPNHLESMSYLTEWKRKIVVAQMNCGASVDIGAVVNRGNSCGSDILHSLVLTQFQLMLWWCCFVCAWCNLRKDRAERLMHQPSIVIYHCIICTSQNQESMLQCTIWYGSVNSYSVFVPYVTSKFTKPLNGNAIFSNSTVYTYLMNK